MAGTRLPPYRTGKGRTDNDIDQGMYKRPSNPLTEDDPGGLEIKLEALTDMLPLL